MQKQNTSNSAPVNPADQSLETQRDGFGLSKQTMDLLLKQDAASDLIALLCFYHYTALWQQTNQPRATIEYVAKGLGWGDGKVRMVKKKLQEIGLVEDERRIDPATNRVAGWFIKLRFFHPFTFRKGGVHPHGLPDCGSSHSVASGETNALRANKGNALRADSQGYGCGGRRPKDLAEFLSAVDKLGYDCNQPIFREFFADMIESDWRDPRTSRPIRNWVRFLQRRLETAFEDVSRHQADEPGQGGDDSF
jgi:hypothetical protein